MAEKVSEGQKERISVCGADCGACYCFGKMCDGCNSCEGRVFHMPEGRACSIYDCVKNNKGMENCGECGEVPCKIWLETRDPKFTDEEFNANVAMRVQALRKDREADIFSATENGYSEEFTETDSW